MAIFRSVKHNFGTRNRFFAFAIAGLCGTAVMMMAQMNKGVITSDDHGKASRRLLAVSQPDFDWTYDRVKTLDKDGQVSPKEWYRLYPNCDGSNQSPIAISYMKILRDCRDAPAVRPFEFNPGECLYENLKYEPTAQNWEVVFDQTKCTSQPYFMMNGAKYTLLQFHLHSHSEHTIGGYFYDAEIHMVHISEDGTRTLVIAVMLLECTRQEGNHQIDNYWSRFVGTHPHYISKDNVAADTDVADPYSMIPTESSYYTYMGSLTTPPCTEGVIWIVMDKPVKISECQLKVFRENLKTAKGAVVDSKGNNSRPRQNLNGRTVYECPM